MNASPRASMLWAVAANLAALMAGLIAALLLLEAGLHVYNPLQTRIKGNRIVLKANGRIRHPNYRGSYEVDKLDREITVTTNAIGFRGPNPPARFAEHLTVIAIGGSTTRCAAQSDDKTWPAHLGRMLDPSFRDLWVNNAGLDGHTTYGHLFLLQDHIAPLHPDVVLFLAGVNDIVVGLENARDTENVRGRLDFRSAKAFLRSLSAYSEVVALALDFQRSVAAHRMGMGHDRVGLRGGMDYEATPEQEQADLAAAAGPEPLAAFAGRLQALIAASRVAAIEPVFLTQPLLVGHCVDDVTGRNLAVLRVGPARNGAMLWDVLEAFNDVTRRTCRESGVLCIDLAREMPKSTRFYYDFMHFNNDGTILVAGIIARSLCPHLAGRYPGHVAGPCAARPGRE